MNSTNPYRSPDAVVDDENSSSFRSSLIWTGLFAGGFVGATYGAAGGGLYGMIVALSEIRAFPSFTVGFVILMITSGAIIGTLWLAILGALFGLPIGWMANRLAPHQLEKFPIISGFFNAIAGLTATLLVLEIFKRTSGSGEFNLYQGLALAVITVVGGWGGFILGRSLQNMRRESFEASP